MKIYMTYKTVEQPWGGANSFLRALKESISRSGDITFVDDVAKADIIFMNQISSGPGNGSKIITPNYVNVLRRKNPKAKLVVRAVNLESHAYGSASIKYYIGKGFRNDRYTKKILRMADFVIYQSAYQKSFFQQAGFSAKNSYIIHNGAAAIFGSKIARPTTCDNTLILLSSAVAGRHTKRFDLIANISKISGVKVCHAGSWPDNVPQGNVELCGKLTHEDLIRRMESAHYMLHPAIKDPCPNALIEGLCAGLPALYNPGPGTGAELAGEYGVSIDEKDLEASIASAKNSYTNLNEKLSKNRMQFSIEYAADLYGKVFKDMVR